jgi:hypothetical protein
MSHFGRDTGGNTTVRGYSLGTGLIHELIAELMLARGLYRFPDAIPGVEAAISRALAMSTPFISVAGR